MRNPAHQQYRERLAILAGSEWMGSVAWLNGVSWNRRFARFDPGTNPYASLVLAKTGPAQELCCVEVHDAYPEALRQDDGATQHLQLGWILVRQFPSDGVLTTLPSVLAKDENPLVLQYWPAKRCTIRFGTNGASQVAKVYPAKYLRKQRGEQLHHAAVSLWNAYAGGELEFVAGRPGHWDPATCALWHGFLEGTPANSLLGSHETLSLLRRMGRAAGSLAASDLRPARRFDHAGQWADSADSAAELGLRVLGLAASAERLLGNLRDIHEHHVHQPLRPIHGDLHPGQFLVESGRLGLLDFDDFSWGEPERDAAFFLVQLACQFCLADTPVALCSSFLGGFESVAGLLDPALLAAYAAHKWLSKALKAARDLNPDGDLLAHKYLQCALHHAAVAADAKLLRVESLQFQEIT